MAILPATGGVTSCAKKRAVNVPGAPPMDANPAHVPKITGAAVTNNNLKTCLQPTSPNQILPCQPFSDLQTLKMTFTRNQTVNQSFTGRLGSNLSLLYFTKRHAASKPGHNCCGPALSQPASKTACDPGHVSAAASADQCRISVLP